MMMPFQVTMLSQYLVLNRLGMLDRPQAVVLPGIFATFSVFIMYRFFRGIPENVMEAARMDGAGEFQIFCGSAYRLEVRASCRHWYFRFWTVLAC